MEVVLGPGETLDRLSGEWWILQLKDGHRYATDDVLVAAAAACARPGALRLLDLGAGVGSIGLMTLRLLPAEACLVSVEVLDVSVALVRRTANLNRIARRVEVRLGDLRDPDVLGSDERFDLVTANPPYLPPGSGWPPRHPQRGSARFELHGDVSDYCRVAARHLAPGGRFCFCYPDRDRRGEEAVTAAGLQVFSRQPIVFRAGRPPHIAVFVCAAHGARRDLPELCVRDTRGYRTADYLQVLRQVGIVA